MKTRTILFALAAVGATFALSAQEPVVGVKDPESLFKIRTPSSTATSKRRCTSNASCSNAASGIGQASG